MKKTTLLLFGALALLSTKPANAQDLVVELMKNNAANIELVKDAKFDVAYGNIGNTSTNTIIGLGEIDFGEQGETYQAMGVEHSNGWGGYGEERYVVLSAGATPETAIPFIEIKVDRTFGYHQFEMFTANIKEADGFVRPIGKQQVWLGFRGNNGNLRSVKFYTQAFAEGEEGIQPWPNEIDGYYEQATVVYGDQFARSVEIPENPEEDPYKDAKYDENTDCWGGIRAGFIVKSTEPIDFGNGDFQQLVAFIGHDGERYTEYMEFYIDEVTPENMIAKTWAGINIQEWNKFSPVATTLDKKVTGSHHLFIKWGDATNLHKIELTKENVWFENPDCGVVYDNFTPSQYAVEFVTLGTGDKGGDVSKGEMAWEIIKPISGGAKGEGSNIGYTQNGVVVKYCDIDFKNGIYKKAYIKHSCDKTYIGSTVEDANFSLYLDLDDLNWGNITTLDELKWDLEDREPIAVIRAQGTGGWGNKMTTVGDLTKVEGIHNLYIVYSLPENAGTNIYGLYLDPIEDPSGIKSSSTIEGLEISTTNGEVIINTTETVNIKIYTTSGAKMAEKELSAGITAIRNLNTGMYILKVVNQQGVGVSKKITVK